MQELSVILDGFPLFLGAGILGSLISAGASILGGVLGRNSANDALDQQREFAKHGIRWKVEDAKAAGIHPLFALGAPPTPFSMPVGNDFGAGIAAAGQDIGRAIDARRTAPERTQARIDALSVERAQLENDLLRSQISKINQAGHPPPLPSATDNPVIVGQGNASPSNPNVIPQYATPTSSQIGRPGQEAGAVADYHFSRTPSGNYAVVPSQDVKNRIEDQLIPELSWFVRNNVIPSFDFRREKPGAPPKAWLPQGYDYWQYNPFTAEYYPAKRWFGRR